MFLNISNKATGSLYRLCSVAVIVLFVLPTINGQMELKGNIELGGYKMTYTITGIAATSDVQGSSKVFIKAENVQLPVTISVSVNCIPLPYNANHCLVNKLGYYSKYQPGSYSSKPMSEGGNSYQVTITESDLVDKKLSEVANDLDVVNEENDMKVKVYSGSIFVLHEQFDLSDAELEQEKENLTLGSREALLVYANPAVYLVLVIPIEEVKKEKKEDPDRVAITVTGFQYDSISNKVVVQGIYRSKTKITSATIFRSMGGTAVQGYINYSDNSFVAECAFERNVPNQFKIVFDNEAKLSAEQTINVNADGSSGSQTTTDASGNTTVEVPPPPGDQPPPDVPGLGPVGNVPGPQDIIKGIIGVVAPGLVGILGGLISGILGGGTGPTPPPVVPQVPKPPIKKPTGPDDTLKKPEDDKKKKPEGKTKEEKEKDEKEKEEKDKEEKDKKEADEKAKREAAEKEKRRKDAREKAKKLLDEQKKADEEMNSWLSQIVNTTKSAGKDVQQGYKDVKDVLIPVITTIKEETKSAIKDIIDSKGKIIVDTAIGTIKDAGQGIKDIAVVGKDIITHPIDIGWETVKGTAHDTQILVTETYGKAIVDMVKNPKKFVDFIYNASGGEDLIMSMDPNRSLVNRSFHYGVAVYKTLLNSMGASGLQAGGFTAIKAAGIRGLTSTVQYGAAVNAPVFENIYHKVDLMSKAGAKHLGVELTQTQKLKITTGLFLDWYKKRYD